jgi:hypothetical protein
MTFSTESEQDKPCPWLSQMQPYKPLGTYPDFDHLKDHLARHYALMAMNPGSIGHARWMVRKLEAENQELAGLGILTAEKIKVLRNEMPTLPSPN